LTAPRCRRPGPSGAGAALLGAALAAAVPLLHAQDGDATAPPGPPPLYATLQEAPLEPAGHVRDAELRVDRFTFELTDGDLYLLPVDGRLVGAVYLGDGRLHAYPPDGPELHQLERLSDEDAIDDRFERFVFWFSGDLGDRLRALADGAPGRDVDRAADLLDDRRDALREDQLLNPDGRVLMDLWRADAGLPAGDPYFFAAVDGREHDWLSLEVEPRREEEVAVMRYDSGRRGTDIWLAANAAGDATGTDGAVTGFPREPADEVDEDDRDFRDFGLSARPWTPAERWTPRATVARTDVDLALDGDGDATATAVLLVEPLVPLAALRLQISPLLEVTDVRWRTDVPAGAEDVEGTPLLGPDGEEADEPAPPIGEPVPFVQAAYDRRIGDDLYEPWLTVLLPRPVEAGERVLIEVAYEGELVERLRSTQDFLLRDTLNWMPRHADTRLTRFGLTFRVPDEYRVSSGGRLAGEREEDGTRILRWITTEPSRAMMAFHYGRFEVEDVPAGDRTPPIAIWGNRNRMGFAPGNRELTLDTLQGALRTFGDFFGPYAFDALTVTETPGYNAQAFPGLVLLTFQAFGQMNTTAAAFLRAHEVAHQWWGASVGWTGYRDQWIPEGFAHYSAALYVLHALGETGEFAEMIDTWRRDLFGQVTLTIGTGRAYYGLDASLVRRSDGLEAGPLVAGYRLASVEKPMEYQLLAYEKGALVLHMLRAMLLDADGGDSRFLDMLRGFAEGHAGGVVSTADFEEAVSAAFGEPMGWFFDQWVYGTEVPTYRPDLEVVATGDPAMPFALRGTVRQEEVRDGFRMPVPIAVELDGGRVETHVVLVDTDEVAVDIPLATRPVRVEFNAGNAVLARVD